MNQDHDATHKERLNSDGASIDGNPGSMSDRESVAAEHEGILKERQSAG